MVYQHLKDSELHTFHDPTIRPWDSIDHCEKWLKTGVSTIDEHSPDIVLKEFVDGKFALKAQAPDT
jgi:hypothetical protein